MLYNMLQVCFSYFINLFKRRPYSTVEPESAKGVLPNRGVGRRVEMVGRFYWAVIRMGGLGFLY